MQPSFDGQKIFFQLISPEEYKADRNRYTTLNDLKENYGEQVDQLVKNMQEISNIISKIWKIYSRSTFKSTTGSGLERMDLILQLAKQVYLSILRLLLALHGTYGRNWVKNAVENYHINKMALTIRVISLFMKLLLRSQI